MPGSRRALGRCHTPKLTLLLLEQPHGDCSDHRGPSLRAVQEEKKTKHNRLSSEKICRSTQPVAPPGKQVTFGASAETDAWQWEAKQKPRKGFQPTMQFLPTTPSQVHDTGSQKSIPALSLQGDTASHAACELPEARSLAPAQLFHGKRPKTHLRTSAGCTDTALVDYRANGLQSNPEPCMGQQVPLQTDRAHLHSKYLVLSC